MRNKDFWENKFNESAATYYYWMQSTIYLAFISLCFPLKMILWLAFSYKTKRVYKILTLNNILDIWIFTIFLTRLVYEYKYYRNNIDYSASDLTNGPYYFNNIFVYRNDGTFHSYLYAAGSAWLWIRIMMLFKLTRFLGPLVKMVENMLNDIAIFMVLFVIELIIFASIGSLLFSSISSFDSLYTSLKTLFSYALGNFDFVTLANNDKSEILGTLYVIIVVVANNILILNLLIAILSSTYALLESKKLVLYINEILSLRSTLEYDKNWSSIVSTFSPFNLVSAMFCPFILIARNPKKLNNILFHLEYIPLLWLITPAYLALNLVLIPFGYIKGNILNLQQVFRKKMEVTIQYRILRFFVFFFFGIFILLLNLWSDCVLFIMHWYQPNLNYRNIKRVTLKVSKNTYKQMYSKIENEHTSHTKTIDIYSLIVYMRESMKLFTNFQMLIFGSTNDFRVDSTNKAIAKIDEYVLIKKIIKSLSLPKGIYIENLKCIMEELKMTSRIKSLISFEENLITLSTRVLSYENEEYLSKFFYVNLGLIHDTLSQVFNNKADLLSIKQTIEVAHYENKLLLINILQRMNNSKDANLKLNSVADDKLDKKQLKKINKNLSQMIDE